MSQARKKCSKCGYEYSNKLKTCPKCKAGVIKNPVVPIVPKFETEKRIHTPKKKMNKKIKYLLLGIIFISIVSIIIAIIINVFNAKSTVNLDIIIPDYNQSKSTKIPLEIKTEASTELYFIGAHGEGLELKNGEYKISFPDSPLCESGIFYIAPKEDFIINLNSSKTEIKDDKKIEFSKAEMQNITDEQIENAYNIAIQDNNNKENAEKYMKKTKIARDKAKEEATKKAAEAAKAEKLGQLKNGFITADYEAADDPNIILHLDIENMKYSISVSGEVETNGDLVKLENINDPSKNGYDPSKTIGIILPEGNFYMVRNETGFDLAAGFALNPAGKHYPTKYNLKI